MLKETTGRILFNKRTALFVILGFTIIRAVIAFTLELGTDEAYYWFYSQELKRNYFEHPPMVAVWVRLFTINLLLQDYEGFIRFGSLLGGALSSWFIFKTCSTLHSEKAGVFGVLLYNTSFFAAITAGVFIMPDSPLMVFYTLCMFLMARITIDENKWSNWILLGVVAGLCILSKIYGAFILLGLALYILFKKRSWLGKPQLWVSTFITVLMISVMFAPNVDDGFEGFRFHLNRLVITGTAINLYTFGREIVNQVLFNNPFNVGLAIAALVFYSRQSKQQIPALTIFNFIGLPLVILLLAVSLYRDTTLPHWSGPAYIAFIPLSAIYLASVPQKLLYFPKVLKGSIAGFFVFVFIWQSLIHFYPGTLGDKQADKLIYEKPKPSYMLGGFTKFQLTAEPVKDGWGEAGEQFAALYEAEIEKGIVRAGTPVVSHKWWGAQILYYFCYPSGIQMVTLGNRDDLHEFSRVNELYDHRVNLSSAYCIVPAGEDSNLNEYYLPYYHQIDSVTVINVQREQRPPLNFHVYRLNGWKNNNLALKK